MKLYESLEAISIPLYSVNVIRLMNVVAGSEHIEALKQQFNIISNAQNSVPVDAPTRCIDYVFHYKNSKPVEVTGSATMTRFRNGDPTKASDHLPVYADVKF